MLFGNASAQANVQDRLSGLGADIVTVSPGFSRATGGFRFGGGEHSQMLTRSAKNLTEKDVQAIKTVEGVAFIHGTVSGRGDMQYLAQTSSVSIQGVDPFAWANIVTTGLEAGRYLAQGDSGTIVVGNRLAKSSFRQPLGLNQVVAIEGRSFRIVGLLKESGGFGSGEDSSVFMPIDDARDILSKKSDYYDSIVFKVNDPAITILAANTTDQRLLLSRHLTSNTKDFTITTAKAIQERLTDVTQTFTLFLGAIAAVSLIVGAVGIANTMFTSVLEKTREIGIMKAIGAKNRDILLIFLLNSGFVGLVSGIIGIGFGVVVSYVLPNFLSGIGPGGSVRTVIPLGLLGEALLVSVAIGMIAGAIPAIRASRQRPVDALRYE